MNRPLAPSVQARHRLHPADLHGKPHRLTVARMTVEGLEGAHPLAHFRGVNLPMALTPAQCNDLARISGSALLSDWVGLTVILDPVESANGWTCVIRGPDEPTAPRPRRRPVFVLSPQVRRMLVFLLLALLVGLALQIEESRALWDWLVSLRVAN